MNFGIYLARSARYWPDRTAVLFRQQALSYRALEERSNRLAHALRALGLKTGDRVALISANRPEIVEAECAFYKLGLVKVALNSRLSPTELEDALHNAEPKACIVGPAHRPVVQPMLQRLPGCTITIGWDLPVDDPHVGDHPAIGVVDGVEDQRTQRRIRVAHRRWHRADDLLKQVAYAVTGLGGHSQNVVG